MLKPTNHSAAASTCLTSFMIQATTLVKIWDTFRTSTGYVSYYINVKSKGELFGRVSVQVKCCKLLTAAIISNFS